MSSLEAVDKDLKAELKDREEDMTRLAKDTARLQLLVHTLRDKMSLELTANRQFRQNIADLKDGQVSATVIIIMIIIMMIAFKGAIPQFFCNLLTALRTVPNTYAQVAWVQLCANHVQHIGRLSRATCVPCRTQGPLSY